MLQKIIVLLAIALYFTGCDKAGTINQSNCSESVCETYQETMFKVWSNGAESFDFSKGSYNGTYLVIIDDVTGSCTMTAQMDSAPYYNDGNVTLSSFDGICDTLYGGQFKYSHLDGMLTLAGGNAGKTYELK